MVIYNKNNLTSGNQNKVLSEKWSSCNNEKAIVAIAVNDDRYSDWSEEISWD